MEPLGDGAGPAAQNTHKYLEEIAIDTARKLADGSLKVNRERPLVERITNKVIFMVAQLKT